ncbi:hypothetical protein K493DRAFT_353562 [Basidiobolus meristosporus CBS 931.73]|uniref:C2H2-type domain-containing protein n=1 Tax=Basidiobolus meristosporus CBS 931.73 TaxID=1314790 RepID=A0A1Y1Y6R5_9FUNG|nr:hypothetical protein K493DRAFT_353562 [Basidiobolus meristosporus CBS 931.73]|eukprot:ORX93274.1 hypothetical protein K493DRAFT_353562 [Basidiobolus meristosporus CBS 931.73]
MQRTFHILSALGILVDFGDNADNEPLMSYTPTYYQLEYPDAYPLLDNTQTNSAENAQALSNQNQYEQVQQVDQTLYQPSASTYAPSFTPDEDDTQDLSDDDDQPLCERCQRRYRRNRYSGRF